MSDVLKRLGITEYQYSLINTSSVIMQELRNIDCMLLEIAALQPFIPLETWFTTSNEVFENKSPYEYVLQSNDPEAAIDHVSMVVQEALYQIKPNYRQISEKQRQRELCKENLRRLAA